MKQVLGLVSLTLIFCFFNSGAMAVNLEELDYCPNPNASLDATKQYWGPDVGYQCKMPTFNFHGDGASARYNSKGNLRWTLLKKEEDLQIWMVETKRWGALAISVRLNPKDRVSVLVSDFACKGDPALIPYFGRFPTYPYFPTTSLDLLVPELGFGYSDPEQPLNYELFMHLGFHNVIPGVLYGRTESGGSTFWTSTEVNGLFTTFNLSHNVKKNRIDANIYSTNDLSKEHRVICAALVSDSILNRIQNP